MPESEEAKAKRLARARAYGKKYYLKNRDRILEKSRQWAKDNPDRKQAACRRWVEASVTNAEWKRAYLRYKKYGITHGDFQLLVLKSKNKCASCGDEFSETNRPQVDHCHDTGVIRGLLCYRCNYAEGFLKTTERARKLFEYMSKNELFYQGGSEGLPFLRHRP